MSKKENPEIQPSPEIPLKPAKEPIPEISPKPEKQEPILPDPGTPPPNPEIEPGREKEF